MRGGQSPASETLSSCSRFATICCVAKKQTFSSAHTKRVVKKANDYPAIIAAFSTKFAAFFSFIVLTMKNQAIDAQTLSSVRKIAALSSRIPFRIAIKNRLR
ncbi:hypothetical protein ACLB1M_32465 [Escherichia coli]